MGPGSPRPVALVLNLASPGTCFAAPAFNEVLEALQVALDTTIHHSEQITDVFDDTLWIVVHLNGDTCIGRIQLVEGHHVSGDRLL